MAAASSRSDVFVDEWFALVERIHGIPKWRWRRRRALYERLDRLEKAYDADLAVGKSAS